MPFAVLLPLLEQYGPAIIGAVMKYGPTVIAAVEKAQADGTLERDVAAIVAAAQKLLPLIGMAKSLDEVAFAIGSLQFRPAEPDDAAMTRVAPDDKFGGR